MQQHKRRTLIALAIVVVLGAGVAGSVLRPWHSGETHANTPPPAPPIEVAAVVGQTITEWDEFSGRLEAVERVDKADNQIYVAADRDTIENAPALESIEEALSRTEAGPPFTII